MEKRREATPNQSSTSRLRNLVTLPKIVAIGKFFALHLHIFRKSLEAVNIDA